MGSSEIERKAESQVSSTGRTRRVVALFRARKKIGFPEPDSCNHGFVVERFVLSQREGSDRAREKDRESWIDLCCVKPADPGFSSLW